MSKQGDDNLEKNRVIDCNMHFKHTPEKYHRKILCTTAVAVCTCSDCNSLK